MSETAQCPRHMASLICFRVVILNFLWVMKWLRGLRFIKKWVIPFLWGWERGEWKALCFQDLTLLSLKIALCWSPRILQPPAFFVFLLVLLWWLLKWRLLIEEEEVPLLYAQHEGISGYPWPFIQNSLGPTWLEELTAMVLDVCFLLSFKDGQTVLEETLFYCCTVYGLESMAVIPKSLSLKAFLPKEHGLGWLTFITVCSSQQKTWSWAVVLVLENCYFGLLSCVVQLLTSQ